MIWNENESGILKDLGYKLRMFLYLKQNGNQSKKKQIQGSWLQARRAKATTHGCVAGADAICVQKMEKQWRGNGEIVLQAVSVVCLWAGFIFCLAVCCKCLLCPVSVTVLTFSRAHKTKWPCIFILLLRRLHKKMKCNTNFCLLFFYASNKDTSLF